MRPDTKRHLHLGVNFILAPAPTFGTLQLLKFQQQLADPVAGIVFDASQRHDQSTVFMRTQSPLEVRLGLVGPQISQLLITASNPERLADDFVDECETIVEAYRAVWPDPVQIVRRDCTIRHLYAVQEPHAFQFLWERRLRQPTDSIEAFGRPVLGGGLRFFMPNRPDVVDDPVIEVKIESLIVDSSQLFVEATFVWNQPMSNADLDPRTIVSKVDNYIGSEVTQFIIAE